MQYPSLSYSLNTIYWLRQYFDASPGWSTEHAKREANEAFEGSSIITKAIDEVLNKKVTNVSLSMFIMEVSGRFIVMSPFDISCTDNNGSLHYP